MLMLSPRLSTVLTLSAENCSLYKKVLPGDEKERIEREGHRRGAPCCLKRSSSSSQCHDFSGLANNAFAMTSSRRTAVCGREIDHRHDSVTSQAVDLLQLVRIVRRVSVSSSASSVRSRSGTSDLVCVSLSFCVPPTNLPRPQCPSTPPRVLVHPPCSTPPIWPLFPLATPPPRLSHPPEGGMWLPNALLSDIVSIQQQPTSIHKSASTPLPFFPSSPEFFGCSSMSLVGPPLRDLNGHPAYGSAPAVAPEERNNTVMVARPTAAVS
jgi:hypothetical protein